MAKLVDAPASGAGDRKVVGVRVPSWAPNTLTRPYMGSNRQIASRHSVSLTLSLFIERTKTEQLYKLPYQSQVLGSFSW